MLTGIALIAAAVIAAADPAACNDADIARDVATGLGWTSGVPPGRVQVVVTAGWVTMSGKVERTCEKRAALDSVRYLRGVLGLTDHIAVGEAAVDAPADR